MTESNPLASRRRIRKYFRLLAERMGFDEPCFKDSDETMACQVLEGTGITFDDLKKDGYVQLESADAPFAGGWLLRHHPANANFSLKEWRRSNISIHCQPIRHRAKTVSRIEALAARFPGLR